MEREQRIFQRLQEGEIGRPYSDEDNPLTISDSDSEITMRVPANHASNLRVGDVVIIYDFQKEEENVWIGGRVQRISTPRVGEGDRKKTLYRKSAPSMADLHVQEQPTGGADPQLFTIEPICMFEEGDRKPNTVCPSNASSLLLPRLDEQEWGEPPLRKILGLPQSGMQIGFYSQNQVPYEDPNEERYQPYYLDLESMMNKHMLVLGTSGTGKTVLLKLLAWQFANDGRAVVAFDVQGDIVQLAAPPTEDQLKNIEGSVDDELWEELDWDELAEGGQSPIPSDEIQVFAPVLASDDQYDSYRLEKIRRWCQDQGITFEEMSIDFMTVQPDRLPLYMPGLTEKAQNALPDLVRHYHEDGPASGNLSHFIDKFVKRYDEYNNDHMVWKEDGREITRIHQATYGNLTRELGNLRSRGIFDVGQTMCPNAEQLAEAGTISIVYLEHLFDEAIESIYEHWTPSLLLGNRMDIPKTHVIIDEAHKVVPSPQITSDEYAKMAASSFVGIARVGRKYNINLVIGTHKPKDINDVVYSLCGTSFAFRMDPKDLNKLDPEDWVSRSVPQYLPGYVAINSPENTIEPWVETKIPRIPVLHQRPGDFFDQI